MSSNAHYLFKSHLRTGMSVFLAEEAPNTEPVTAKRGLLELGLNITKTDLNDREEVLTIYKRIALYGPGELGTFEAAAVKTHDPRDAVADYEPNYFPAVDFWDPDFPWRYTPFGARRNEKLKPWLALVVLVAEDSNSATREFEHVPVTNVDGDTKSKQLPFIKNISTANLPDLSESWRWANMQVTGDDSLKSGVNDAELAELMLTEPERVISRLLCARRLQPGVLYNAFLVPVFKLGIVASGLIEDDESINISTLSWSANSSSTVNLPYYFQWEFRTGERGDFEKLVRDLRPRVLKEIGLRSMACDQPGYGLESRDVNGPLALDMEGALKTLDTEYSHWGRDVETVPWLAEELQSDLESLLNKNEEKIDFLTVKIESVDSPFGLHKAGITIKQDAIEVRCKTSVACDCGIQYGDSATLETYDDVISNDQKTEHRFRISGLTEGRKYRIRIVAKTRNSWDAISESANITFNSLSMVLPPMYGQWHAKRKRVSSAAGDGSWFHTLNLDPRHRAAAGLGAEVIRREQEPLMASAWEQAGDIDFANMIIKRSKMGIEVSGEIAARMALFSDPVFLMNTRAVHARSKAVLAGSKLPLSMHIKQSRIPKAAFDPAFRRLLRKNGPVIKQMERAGREPGAHILTSLNDSDDPFRAAGDAPDPTGATNACMFLKKVYQKLDAAIDDQLPADAGDMPGHCCCCCYCVARRKDEDHDGATDGECCQCQMCRRRRKNQSKRDDESRIEEGAPESPESADHDTENSEVLKWREMYGKYEGLLEGRTCEETLSGLFSGLRDDTVGRDGEVPAISEESSARDKVSALSYAIPGLLASDPDEEIRPTLDIADLRSSLVATLDPSQTIAARLYGQLELAPGVSFSIDKIMPAPEFPQPMYVPLRSISQDHICPGIRTIKENTVALLSTNGRFIESFMCGLSHEFAAELLWREYPTDQRGTYFKQFWEPVRSLETENLAKSHSGADSTPDEIEDVVKEILEDIRPIDEWKLNELGDNPSNLAYLASGEEQSGDAPCEDDENIVLVIRGNLLKKYPDTEIYIYREEDNATQGDADNFFESLVSATDPDDSGPFSDEDPIIFDPAFRADIPADISLVGFNLKVCDILEKKHYLVLEERVSRVRHGLDIRYDEPQIADPDGDWNNLSWDHFSMNDDRMSGKYLDGRVLTHTGGLPSGTDEWGANAANNAGISQQKPVRIAISLNDMIPKELLNG